MSRTLLLVLALVGGIYGYEYVTVTRPAAQAMAEDYRNDNVPLVADLKGLGTSRLRLNVDSDGAGEASPAGLWRTLFQIAERFHEKDPRFDEVHLSRNRETVFTNEGDDFAEWGYEFSYGENPVYMIRMLPEKLNRPDGSLKGRRYEARGPLVEKRIAELPTWPDPAPIWGEPGLKWRRGIPASLDQAIAGFFVAATKGFR